MTSQGAWKGGGLGDPIRVVFLWRSDKIKFIFQNPDSDGKSTEVQVSAVDLAIKLSPMDPKPKGW